MVRNDNSDPADAVDSVDLGDRSGCPVTGPCEGCGAGAVTLAPYAANAEFGVLCVVLCTRCADAARVPRFGAVTAAERVLAHCEHLGIDLHTMAMARGAELDAERAGGAEGGGW